MSDNQELRSKVKVLPEFRASLKSLDVRSPAASDKLTVGSDISSPALISPPAIKSSTIYEHVPHTQGAAMTYVTESLLDARLEAAEARTEARVARLEIMVENSIKTNEAAVSRIEKALRVLSTDTKQAIDGLRSDNQQSINGLRSDTKQSINGLRADTKQSISELRADNKYTRTTVVVTAITSFIALLIGLGGLMVAMQSNSMSFFLQGTAFKDSISTEVSLQNQSLNSKVEAVEAKLDTLIEAIAK